VLFQTPGSVVLLSFCSKENSVSCNSPVILILACMWIKLFYVCCHSDYHPVELCIIFVVVQTLETECQLLLLCCLDYCVFTCYISCHILQMLTIECEVGKRLVMVTFVLTI